MSDVVRDAIAASIALETRIVATPSEPFGWGSDIACALALDPDVRELDGDDPQVLANAIIRRLDTPRGQLPDDPDYGIALRSMLSAGITDAGRRSISGRIYNEITKDERVDSLRVDVTPGDESLTIALTVTPVEGEPFTTTLAVTSAGVVLEAIS
jgi:phage baseplate assembly protein W